MTHDLESRIAAGLHRAGDMGDVPESNLDDVFLRTRRRRSARRVVGGTVVVALLTVGGLVFVGRDHASNRRIKAGVSPSTVAPSVTPARPVLDGCTTTSAIESVVKGSSAAPGAKPPIQAEVFADPARGVSGPLVVLLRGSGALLRTGDGVAGGGKIVNAQINGRDADVEFWGTHGGVVWDSSSGGSASLWEWGLSEDEMRAVAEELDAGTTELPQGLVSLGMTDTALVSTSFCTDQQHGQIAIITEIRGNQASRYSEAVFDNTADARRFDQGNATIVIDGVAGGNFDIANATYHEATPEEWHLICIRAGSACRKR